MPRFLYSALVASAFSLLGLLYIIFTKDPQNLLNRINFILLVFIFFTFSGSVVTYAIKYQKAERHTDLRTLYRNSLKVSAFWSLAIISQVVLKAFGVFTIINGTLLLILIFLIRKLLKGRP